MPLFRCLPKTQQISASWALPLHFSNASRVRKKPFWSCCNMMLCSFWLHFSMYFSNFQTLHLTFRSLSSHCSLLILKFFDVASLLFTFVQVLSWWSVSLFVWICFAAFLTMEFVSMWLHLAASALSFLSAVSLHSLLLWPSFSFFWPVPIPFFLWPHSC